MHCCLNNLLNHVSDCKDSSVNTAYSINLHDYIYFSKCQCKTLQKEDRVLQAFINFEEVDSEEIWPCFINITN